MRFLSFIVLLFYYVSVEEICAQDVPQTCRYADGRVHCYSVILPPNTWDNVKAACVVSGGSLTIADTVESQLYADDNGQNFADVNITEVWFGLRHDGVEWVWVTADNVPLDNPERWDTGEPSVDSGCAYMAWEESLREVVWKQASCSDIKVGLCEIQADPPEICREDGSRRHCYRPSKSVGGWQDARDQCQAAGGDLAVSSDELSQRFLDENLHLFAEVGLTDMWLGLRNNTVEWRWINDEVQTDPDRWDIDQEQQHGCAYLLYKPGLSRDEDTSSWGAEGCSQSKVALCEFITGGGLATWEIILIVIGTLGVVAVVGGAIVLLYYKVFKKLSIDSERRSSISSHSSSSSSSSSNSSKSSESNKSGRARQERNTGEQHQQGYQMSG